MFELPLIEDLLDLSDGRSLVTLLDSAGHRSSCVFGQPTANSWRKALKWGPLIDLRRRALDEMQELGPPPSHPAELELWAEERRGAAVLVAGLADWNGPNLRRAALAPVGVLADDAKSILLDAALIADEETHEQMPAKDRTGAAITALPNRRRV